MSLVMKDLNETIKPPAGSDLTDVQVHGSFLVLKYFRNETGENTRYINTTIYVNDQGREVLRTVYDSGVIS